MRSAPWRKCSNRLRQDVGTRYESARQEGAHASIFNQLAELTSFAPDEAELVAAAMRAIRRLVPTPSGNILLANPSQNRLTVAVAWGEGAPEPGTLVDVDRIDRCPGIRRAAAFVAEDLGDDLSVRCPAHPAESGTVACVPDVGAGQDRRRHPPHQAEPNALHAGPDATRGARG